MVLHKIYLSLLILIVFSAYSMQRNDDEFFEGNLYALLDEFDPMDVDSDTQTTTTSAASDNFDLLSGVACDINEAYRAQSNQNPQDLSINVELQPQTNPENFEEKNNDTNSLMELLPNSTDLSEEKNQEATDSSNQSNLISKKRKDDSEIANSSKKRKTSSRAQQTRRFKCDVEGCNESYNYPSGLRNHKRGIHGDGYKCDKCNKVYSHLRSLERHKKAKHKDRTQGNQNSQEISPNLQAQTETNALSGFLQEKNQEDLDEETTDFLNQNVTDSSNVTDSINEADSISKKRKNNLDVATSSKKRKISSRAEQKKKFKCDFKGCNESYQNSSKLYLHKIGAHGEGFKCDVEGCNKSYKYPGELDAHKRNGHNERFKCDVPGCNKSYQHASGLSHHKRGSHGRGFKCIVEGCNKTFNHAQLLKDHEIVFHSDGYKCDKCNKFYRNQASLLTHKQVEHEKGFKCQFKNCGKTFTSKRRFNQHKKASHVTDEITVNLVEKVLNEENDIEQLMIANVQEQVTKKSEINESENTSDIQSTNNSSNINDLADISEFLSKESEIQEEEKSGDFESWFLETDPDDNYVIAPIEEVKIFEAGDSFEVTNEDNIIIKPTNTHDLCQSAHNTSNDNFQDKQSTLISDLTMEEKESTCKLESQTQTKNPDTKIIDRKLSDTHFEIEALKGSILVLNQMLKNEPNNAPKIGIKKMLILIKNRFGNTEILQILANSEDKHINLIRLTLEICVAKLQKIYTESDDVYRLATEIKTLINSNITSIIVCD